MKQANKKTQNMALRKVPVLTHRAEKKIQVLWNEVMERDILRCCYIHQNKMMNSDNISARDISPQQMRIVKCKISVLLGKLLKLGPSHWTGLFSHCSLRTETKWSKYNLEAQTKTEMRVSDCCVIFILTWKCCLTQQHLFG